MSTINVRFGFVLGVLVATVMIGIGVWFQMPLLAPAVLYILSMVVLFYPEKD